MKNFINLLLAAILALSLAAPAVAQEQSAQGAGRGLGSVNTNLRNLRDRVVARYSRRLATLSGNLTEIRGVSAPTELLVKVRNVVPRKNRRWTGAYPAAGQEVVVRVATSTRIVRQYGGKSSLEELTLGDKLQIVGKTNEDGSVSASLIKDNSIHITFRVHTGVIQSLDEQNTAFVMRQARRDVAVDVNDRTKIIMADGATSTFAALAVGNKVHVRGVINRRTRKIDAHLVRVVPRPAAVESLPVTVTTSTVTSTPFPTPAPTTSIPSSATSTVGSPTSTVSGTS